MIDVKEYAKTLAAMCLDLVAGKIDEETFKANLSVINSILNEENK